MTSLGFRKWDGESWRDAVKRIAEKEGLAEECLQNYDEAVRQGASEADTAWSVLYDWDLLEVGD